MFPLSAQSPFLGSFFMPLVSVKFSDHCHFLHFSVELLALGGNITLNVCRLIVYCVGHCQCAEISLTGLCTITFSPVARFAHTNMKKKKERGGGKSVSFDSREEVCQYVCLLSRTVHTWIRHFHPCSSRGSQQLYLTGT